MKRRLLVLVGALALAFMAMPSTSAFAATLEIKGDQVNTTAASFGTQDCGDTNCTSDATHDAFHFVVTGDATVNSATFTFSTDTYTLASGNVTHWTTGGVTHICVLVPTGATLLSATADVTGGTNPQFNLSHTCPTPGTEVPEVPFAALIPLTALLLIAGVWVVRRRRSIGGAAA